MGSIPRDSDLIGLIGAQALGFFKSSPGNSNEQPILRILLSYEHLLKESELWFSKKAVLTFQYHSLFLTPGVF